MLHLQDEMKGIKLLAFNFKKKKVELFPSIKDRLRELRANYSWRGVQGMGGGQSSSFFPW